MANATITTMVQLLCTISIDAAQVADYEDDVFFELARGGFPGILVQTSASFLAVTSGTAEYTLPAVSDGARRILAVFYDDQELALARHEEAQFFDPAWRSRRGRPIAYIQDPTDRTKFEVVPPPAVDGKTIGANTPLVFTAPFPAQNLTVIHARTIIDYSGFTLVDTYVPVAFEVLARELGRDSDHKDETGAAIAKAMAAMFWQMCFPEVTERG